MTRHTLSIDLEDYSPVDIKYGVHKRAEEGEILMIAYSLDYAPPVCIDLCSGEEVPTWFIKSLTDPNYKKKAYNAPYERAYLGKWFNSYTPPEQWECTLVRAAMCGLPLGLDDSSKALGLSEKKDPIGKMLIRYFCMPCKPTEANGYRTRNMPWHDPEKWLQFISYCNQDVVTEQAVDKACSWYIIPAQEHHLWCLNEKKNERGVMVDLELIDSAMALDKAYRDELTEEANALGVANPNSVNQISVFIEANTDLVLHTTSRIFVDNSDQMEDVNKWESMNKQKIAQLLETVENPQVKRILQIRQLMSRSSIKKYATMKLAAGTDCRLRGMIQYYGANRTGRNSGRIAQPQNFPRIQEWFQEMIDDTRELVKRGDMETLHMVFENLSDVLSQLLRTTFIAEKGKEFVVLDLSAIEAVVLSALANETWRLKVFADGGDIYKATASAMFKVAVKDVNKDQRQKAKVSELLCGFGGSVPAMERMNETIQDPKKRIPKKEMPGLIKDWRTANPNIVQLWWDTDAAAKNAIRTGDTTEVTQGIKFGMKNGNLLMRLPSGRCLVYQKAHLRKFYVAHIEVDDKEAETLKTFVNEVLVSEVYQKKINHVKVGEVRNQSYAEYNKYLSRLGLKDNGTKPGIRETVCFWGQNQTTKKWEVNETYGPRLVENFTQATARDVLMNGIIKIEAGGCDVLLDVHDEIVSEVVKGSVTLEQVKKLMLDLPDWCKNWPVRAEGFIADYYQK